MTRTSLEMVRLALVRADKGIGRPYPESARRAAVEVLEDAQREGRGLARVAKQLGISATTLRKWEHAERRAAPPTFREVTVVSSTKMEPTTFVVHGPCGVRIEGLTIDAMAELVRRLA